jgi:hypothetical protein
LNTFEYSESTGSQNKQADAPLSIADIGILKSLNAPENGTMTGSPSGGARHPAGDVRSVNDVALPNLVIKQGSIADYDGDPGHESKTQRTVVAEAVSDLGKELWHNWTPGHIPGGGACAELGCAASVSQILDDCGAAKLYRPEDDNCDYMQEDLLAQGWTLTEKPQPGDVWIGRGGESEAHTGIIGESYTLMDNHSSNGCFSRDSAGFTNAWTNSVYLQPPEQSGPPAKPAVREGV